MKHYLTRSMIQHYGHCSKGGSRLELWTEKSSKRHHRERHRVGSLLPLQSCNLFFSGLASSGYASTRKMTFTRSGVTSTRLTKARIISRLLSQSESSNPASILAAKSSKRPTIRRISV